MALFKCPDCGTCFTDPSGECPKCGRSAKDEPEEEKKEEDVSKKRKWK